MLVEGHYVFPHFDYFLAHLFTTLSNLPDSKLAHCKSIPNHSVYFLAGVLIRTIILTDPMAVCLYMQSALAFTSSMYNISWLSKIQKRRKVHWSRNVWFEAGKPKKAMSEATWQLDTKHNCKMNSGFIKENCFAKSFKFINFEPSTQETYRLVFVQNRLLPITIVRLTILTRALCQNLSTV